jgi:hypothetical protein
MPPIPNQRMKFRRDTAARWAQVNPVLSDGEPGFEKDTGQLKVGDGTTVWVDLKYFVPHDPNTDPTSITSLAEHILSEAPHPFYDDGRDFTVLYENAKV